MRAIFSVLLIILAVSCSKPNNQPSPPDEQHNPDKPDNEVELTIASITPISAETGPVTITGSGFSSAVEKNEVKLSNLTATVVSANSGAIVIELPEDLEAGDHDVIVKTNNKSASKTNGFHRVGWVVTHFAGSGLSGTGDGVGLNADFRTPSGLANDLAGNIYVADLHKIRRISRHGEVVTIAGGNGRGYVDGNAADARFNFVASIALDATGNIYVTDAMNFVIRKITPAGTVTTVAGLAGEYGNADGAGEKARFSMPYGLAINESNTHLFVGDEGNNVIRQVEIATGIVTTIAGSGEATSKDGRGLEAGIPSPGSMAFDGDGNLYITEKGGGRVRKMSPDGFVSTIGGDLSVNTSPTHVAVDEHNNVYVTYSGMGKIKKYSPNGVESDFAGNNWGTGVEEGAAKTVFFRRPEGIVIIKDANGDIEFYVADAQSHRIKKIKKE